MSKMYYTVISRSGVKPWEIEYGSFDQQDCVDEVRDIKDHNLGLPRLEQRKTMIIKTGALQEQINAKVREINVIDGFVR